MTAFTTMLTRRPTTGANFPRPFTLLPQNPDLDSIARQCGVTVDEIEDAFPCTPLQEGLMAITAQQRNTYIAQIALAIPGSIDLARFKSSWECLIRHCAILRTRILFDDSGKSIQVVTRCPTPWHTGGSLPRYLQYDLAQSMEYAEPLTRFAIINDQHHTTPIFVWTIHHAIYDGWTIRLLFDRLSHIYNGPTPSPPPPFSSYIQYLQSVGESDCKTFWRRRLAGNDATSWPEVPSQAKANADQTVLQSFHLAPTLRHDVTVPTLLQAAWAISLSLHVSSQKVMFAQVFSGRNIPLPHAVEVVGPMLSTVPMCIEVDFTLSVAEYLRQLQIQEANLIEYQHIGLQNIHRLLLAEGHQFLPLNNMFVVQPREESGGEGASLGMKEVPGYSMELGVFDTFAVNVQCNLKGDTVDVRVAFDSTLVPPEAMAHVLAVFIHLSQELAVADGDLSLAELTLIPASDVSLILLHQKPPPPPVQRCIHQIIEDHVRDTPDAIAIHGFDKVITYAQLWQASDRLAETFTQAGVSRGSLVPLCFEKSAWAIVSMLAVLKAGGACVNLDPTHPLGRIETIIQDIEAKVLVVSPAQRVRLGNLVSTLIAVDERLVQQLSSEQPFELKTVSSHPTDAAFVIYTSGTTGKPKGIVNTHQALVSSAAAHGAALDIGPQTRAIQFASYAFDSSIQDISTVLQRGGTICVISETDRTSNFAAAVRSVEGNYSLLTTSVASLYTPDDLPTVRTLQLGGEPMRKVVLQAWGKRARVMNTYGPAECSINVTCAADMQADDQVSNIGYPVGCRCWVIHPDNANQLMPLGCTGELLVEGPILARGYLHDPEKTRAAFIPSPLWRQRLDLEPCERLYRTGDLVFQSAEGSFSYVGRKDGQVKLNGQRLEVEEVESLLQRHLAIHQAAVVLPKAGPFANRLVATFTTTGRDDTSNDIRLRPMQSAARTGLIDSLQNILTQSLPASIKVSYFVPVWHIPLTISRKLDRKSIRNWLESMSNDLQQAILGIDTIDGSIICNPRNPKEATVQNACSRVLGLPNTRVDLQKSFFGIGGDSIGAIQLVFRLRTEGFTTTVPDILQASTLADIAHCVEVETQCIPAADEPDENPFGLSLIQQWYFSVQPSDEGYHYYNQSVYGTLSRHIDEQSLREAVATLVKHHPMLRARFQQVEGNWCQAIRPVSHDNFAFRSHIVGDQDSRKLADVVESSHCSLDIINGPIFAVDLINFLSGRQSLLLVAHHLAVDIVSWTILLDDLDLLLRGEPILLREWTSFQSWCRLNYENLMNPRLVHNDGDNEQDGDLEYWGLSSQTQITNRSQKVTTVVVDPETTSLFLRDANKTLHTEPVDLLLSAVCMSFLNAFKDRHELNIFNEGHGRDTRTRSVDLSRTVGWFTVILCLSFSRRRASDLMGIVQMAKDLRKLAAQQGTEAFARRCLLPKSRQKKPMEILFNYHGCSTLTEDADKVFHEDSSHQYAVQDQGPNWPISALFEIGVTVGSGVAEFTVYWPEQLLYQEKIRAWINSIPDFLRLIATELTKHKAQAYSLSDFPLLALDYPSLDKLQDVVLPQIRKYCQSPIQDVMPCSPMQDGLLLAQIKQGKDYYQITQEYEIRPTASGAPLDVHRLGSAWKQVISRHPSLRTVFVDSVDGSSAFSQIVLESFEPDIVYLDNPQEWSKLSPVNYSQLRPPHRLTLVPASSGTVMSRLEISHAITDAISTSIILRDWAQAYDGTPQAQQEEQPTYAEFIKHIFSIPHQKRLDYWTTYLTNVEPCHFPSMGAFNASAQCHTAVREINQHESICIRQYCSDIGVSLATLFQAAWSLVLSQYTGSDDVCFGYLASGRDAHIAGLHNAVGAFVNMLICRVQFSSSPTTASQFTQDIQQESLKHFRFQHCTLAEIHHALEIPHGRTLFNSIMSFQNDATPADDIQCLEFIEKIGCDPTEFDLSIGVTAGLQKIQLSLDYYDTFISPQQASMILCSFQHAVITIINDPGASIRNISLLQEQDFATIQAWNGPFPMAERSCIHAAVSANAKYFPDAPAICSFDGDLSYHELDEISTRLAQVLILAGVQLEQMVPLCFDKSISAAVSMLAVLKVGGVCVALGPASPAKQLHETLANIRASIVLVSPQHVDLFEGIHKIVVDHDLMLHLTTCSLPRLLPSLLPGVSPDNAAFVVFTSGSTGTPKGIVLEHASVVTSSKAHGSAMGFTTSSRVLQFSAYTFDVSIQDIFTTWQHGGCVCIISEQERLNDLAGAINARQANFADLTPSVAGLLPPPLVPCLETISMGGEVVPQSLNELWQQHVRVVNLYGPAETTINAAFTDKADRESQPASIGRPLASWFWVVNPNDADVLVPIGCIGELLIEGPLLARGYLNNKSKTEEVFITDPKWSRKDPFPMRKSTRRMYKTGDLVHLNHDGTYTYIGRKDRQVKLHGQRIEMDAIDHCLQRLAPKDIGVMTEVIGVSGNKQKSRLAAFLDWSASLNECERDNPVLLLPLSMDMTRVISELRNSLYESLPPHMHPSFYIPLRRFPLTASGKLDRKKIVGLVENMSLSEQNQIASVAVGERQAPTSQVQEILHSLITSLLSLQPDAIGMDDSFFALGGDSVKAIMLAQEARKRGLALSVADILRHPRIKDLSDVIAMQGSGIAQGKSRTSAAPKPFSLLGKVGVTHVVEDLHRQYPMLERSNIDDILPVTDFQALSVSLGLSRTRSLMPYFSWQRTGLLDLALLKKSCQSLVRRFDSLRTAFVFHGSHCLQVILRDLKVEIPVYETEQDLAEFTMELRRHDMYQPPVLGEPVTQFAIIHQTRQNQSRLVIRLSHAQYDGMSVSRMWDALDAAVQGRSHCDDGSDPSFVYYMHSLASIDKEKACRYWSDLLYKAPMHQFISHAHPRLESSCTMLNFSRTIDLTTFTGHQWTFATVLNAAWAHVLGQLATVDDVVFGSMVNGRNLPGVETVFGACVSCIPVRVKLSSARVAEDLIKAVHEQKVAGGPYEAIGHREIIKSCTDWPHWAFFSSLVLHQNTETSGSESGNSHGPEFSFDVTGWESNLADVTIESIPSDNAVELSIYCGSDVLPASLAMKVHDRLCQTVIDFCRDSQAPLPSSSVFGTESPNSQLALTPVSSSPASPVFKYEDMDITIPADFQSLLRSLWMTTLGPRLQSSHWNVDSSFFTIGGDLISACHLMEELKFHGIKCTLEDLVNHHTWGEQLQFLGSL